MTTTTLGKVARFSYGVNLPAVRRRPGRVPVYGSNGVVGWHDEALSPGPGIVIGRKGSIGKVHLCHGPFWAIDTTYYLDASNTSCDIAWLTLLLKSLDLARFNRATGVPGLDRNEVESLQVKVPNVTLQYRVATQLTELLKHASSAIEAIDVQLGAAVRLPAALFRQALGSRAPVAAGLPDEVERWPWQPLLDLARLESGHTPSRRHPEWWGGDVPWLALPDIRKLHGLLAYDTTESTNNLGIANSSARLLPVGTVCLCRDASIGFVTMLGRPMATSQHFCNWICDPEKLDAEFLLYAFMASFDYLRDLGSGSVLKTVYMPTIESFHLCTPPLDEQRRIAEQLRGQLARTRQLQTHLADRRALIERLPQRILADAFGAAA